MIKRLLHLTLFASTMALMPAAAQTTPIAPTALQTGFKVTQPQSVVVYRPARVIANAAQTTALETAHLLPLFTSAGVTIPASTVPRELVVTFYNDGSSALTYIPAPSLTTLPNPPGAAPTVLPKVPATTAAH